MLSYYFTFWHIYRDKNIEYVHVIIPVHDKVELISFDYRETLYTLRQSSILNVTKGQIEEDNILNALLRDGESLVAKMQEHLKIKNKNNEIR